MFLGPRQANFLQLRLIAIQVDLSYKVQSHFLVAVPIELFEQHGIHILKLNNIKLEKKHIKRNVSRTLKLFFYGFKTNLEIQKKIWRTQTFLEITAYLIRLYWAQRNCLLGMWLHESRRTILEKSIHFLEVESLTMGCGSLAPRATQLIITDCDLSSSLKVRTNVAFFGTDLQRKRQPCEIEKCSSFWYWLHKWCRIVIIKKRSLNRFLLFSRNIKGLNNNSNNNKRNLTIK